MEFNPRSSEAQFMLTRVCQVIANPNSRRMLEIIAITPQTVSDLAERIDSSPTKINSALTLMTQLHLVKPVRVPPGHVTYTPDDGGLRLVRSWLDRIASILEGTGQLKG
jgi:hypothetical protein